MTDRLMRKSRLAEIRDADAMLGTADLPIHSTVAHRRELLAEIDHLTSELVTRREAAERLVADLTRTNYYLTADRDQLCRERDEARADLKRLEEIATARLPYACVIAAERNTACAAARTDHDQLKVDIERLTRRLAVVVENLRAQRDEAREQLLVLRQRVLAYADNLAKPGLGGSVQGQLWREAMAADLRSAFEVDGGE